MYAINRLVLVTFLSAASAASAQQLADEVYKACSPIILGAVNEEQNFAQKGDYEAATASVMCSQTFTSEEQARSSGLDVDAVIKGVRVGAIFSSNEKTRKEARQLLCADAATSERQSFEQTLRLVRKSSNAAELYTSCIYNYANLVNKDLACYFTASPGGTGLWLIARYRPSMVQNARLSRALLAGGEDAETHAKDLRPHIRSRFASARERKLGPFTFSQQILRTELDSPVSFSLALDDGQEASCSTPPRKTEVSGSFDMIGARLGDHSVFIYASFEFSVGGLAGQGRA